MGAVGGLLGVAGGANGTGFQAPAQANLVNPTNMDQITGSYSQNQFALGQQQNLLQALQAQNGLANQSNVYNQLQGVANGTGPNPAQAMLNQATGQNVANQAALMAGQRGASANAGLIARQAAQQGANIQQQAVGQGATMQAQQALNAINASGNIANTQVSNQIGQNNAVTGAQQAEQNALLGAQQGFNQAQVGSQQSVNSGNAALADENMKGQQSAVGGIVGSLGGLTKFLADGGPAHMYATGNYVDSAPLSDDQWSQLSANPNMPMPAVSVAPTAPAQVAGPTSRFGQYLKGALTPLTQNTDQAAAPTGERGLNDLRSGFGSLTSGLIDAAARPSAPVAQGSSAGVMGQSMMAAGGGQVRDLKTGGSVKAANKAEKAVQSGNSYANDKIPAVLSEGEYVLDRNTINDQGPIGQSARALIAALKKAKGEK